MSGTPRVAPLRTHAPTGQVADSRDGRLSHHQAVVTRLRTRPIPGAYQSSDVTDRDCSGAGAGQLLLRVPTVWMCATRVKLLEPTVNDSMPTTVASMRTVITLVHPVVVKVEQVGHRGVGHDPAVASSERWLHYQ